MMTTQDTIRIGRSSWDELRNFEEIARLLKPSPGEIPRLEGIEVHGTLLPLREAIGGDLHPVHRLQPPLTTSTGGSRPPRETAVRGRRRRLREKQGSGAGSWSRTCRGIG